MNRPWTARMQAIEDYRKSKDYTQYNIGHIVMDDLNTDNESILFALKYARLNEKEYLNNHRGAVRKQDIDETIEFMEYLLTIPESDDD